MKDILIRPYDSTDKEMIYSSWLNNYKHSSHATKRIRNHVYFVRQHEVIDRLLKRAVVTIACLPDTPDAILGYLVLQLDHEPVVHYLFIKEDWRGLGIAKDLITFSGIELNKPIYFTHWTNPMDSIVNRKDIELIYDPYKI